MKTFYESTGRSCHIVDMTFQITLSDNNIETIPKADGYQLEGPLTTFFSSDGHTMRLSSWSTRIASYRTEQITCIRKLEEK